MKELDVSIKRKSRDAMSMRVRQLEELKTVVREEDTDIFKVKATVGVGMKLDRKVG